MARLAARVPAARVLVAAFWAGSLWVLGYVAAPAAFSVLPGIFAGDMVGALLHRLAWVSFVCAALMVLLVRMSPDLDAGRRRSLNLLVLAMLACALVMHVGLQPEMARMRQLAGLEGIRETAFWKRFVIMHGVSQLFHVIESLLAAVLLLRSR